MLQLGARFYWPEVGRFVSQDPIGDGVNWYTYAEDNPVVWVDPTGLCTSYEVLRDASNFFAGVGDTVSFGLSRSVRQRGGYDYVVSPGSGMYSAGAWTGVGLSAATGAAGGIKAAGTKALGKEFSHFIPKWFGRRIGGRLGGAIQRNSIWNGNYVARMRHFKHDPFRYPTGYKQWGDKFWPGIQQLDRIPWVYRGTGVGVGYGLGGRAANGPGGTCPYTSPDQ